MTEIKIKTEWFLAFCAFRLWLLVPRGWRIWWTLLPSAGLYAYTDGGLAEYRRERTGFMTCRRDRGAARKTASKALERASR